MHIDYSIIPESVKIDLCTLALKRIAETMKSPEGRAAIEKGKKEYLHHLEETKVKGSAN